MLGTETDNNATVSAMKRQTTKGKERGKSLLFVAREVSGMRTGWSNTEERGKF